MLFAVISNPGVAVNLMNVSYISDPNVEVIYICPVKINDELNDYYMKLLQVMSNITGQDHEVIKTKLKILTPTHHDRFPVR